MAAHEVLAATNAVVTLDVGLPGIVWGWIITMNMWAKSIGTGVIFMLFYLIKRYPDEAASLRFPVTVLSIVFIHIFLFFTVIDLHQMFRFWHIFFYPNWTSAITVGAWIVTILVLVLFGMAFASFIKKDNELFDKLLTTAVILAVPVTLYTAAIMAESTARELWQGPTEAAQMLLAATLTGSATLLLIGQKLSYEAKRDLGIVMGMSALIAFLLYMNELVFGPMKAEEVAATLEFVKGHGEYTTMFWVGQVVAFIVPMVLVLLSVTNRSASLLGLAAVSAIAGLWVVKHVWLVIPQLLNMS
ncbi:MAG: NrfD/PsrC family molybdoenzyme membrane anchor subunit [Campylobacterota bacterium]|nr:NrfD/PsrC family molybdoenzyme membrane anchor subunit [Campylobacterota bacterium]